MVTEIKPNGTIVISAVVDGYLQSKKYIDFTVEEAEKMFSDWVEYRGKRWINADDYVIKEYNLDY